MLAIVLSRRDFREHDQIISLYTKEKGKISALARGVKKITSKNSAHLEPFSVIHATIEHGKEIDHLTRVQPVEYFSGIRSEYEKSIAAGFVASVTDTLTHEGERDTRIFELLWGWVKYIEEIGNKKLETVRLIDGFIVSLFHYLGFTPILHECVVCGKTYNEVAKESLTPPARRSGGNYELRTLNSGMYFAAGGLICSSCRKQKEMVGEEIFDCGLKEVSDMQMLLKGDWRLISEFDLTEDEQKKLHRLVYEYAVYHSERKIGDWGRITLAFEH